MEPLQVADPLTSLISPGAPHLIKEKVPAAADTDNSTKQTIAKMCEYRRAAANDPIVKRWAHNAHQVYGQNCPDSRAKAWGAYWQVKHGVKFASDEPRLFQVGEPAALDLLIAPAVLVRQPNPEGDCDDFTMLIQALLDQMGIESYTVTIAADPSDPERWSHVFCVCKLPDGTLCSMDASHGNYPGWMVPREHIFRWQGWDSAGNPVNLPIPEKQGLHGYIPTRRRHGMRGLGICDYEGDPTCSVDTTGGGTSSIPIDWGSVISNIITSGAKVAQVAELPPGGFIQTTPSGQVVSAGGGSLFGSSLTGAFSSLGSFLPWILLAVVGFAVVQGMEGGRR